jgi:pimeloyl-ACP methyl ester carboxylesterase
LQSQLSEEGKTVSFIKDSVVTENFSMDYIRFGSGRKTLVILPGLSVQSVIPAAADIEKQYDLFKKDYTVYLFDRRRELPDEYSVFDMADDTAKAIQTLGLHDCCIFGASQGGMIAAAIALKYPSLACRLVLGSTAARIDGKRAEKIGNWISLA